MDKKGPPIHIQKSATYGDWSVYCFPLGTLEGFETFEEARQAAINLQKYARS